MAGEVQLEHSTTGQTLYFLVRNATGSIWNGTAFEAYQTADLDTQYSNAMTEQGTASRYYVGDFPAAAAGVYRVTVRIKASGSHAETDVTAGAGTIEWDGSAVVSLYSRLAPTTAGRTLDVTAGGEAGIDWANVGSPTTTLALTGTTIATTQKVDVETIKTQAVTCASGVTVLASVGTAATSTAQTGDSYAIVNSGTHGNAAIKGYVDDIGTAGAGLTAVPWNAAWDAEVQSEVEDALVVHRLDELLNADSDIDGAAPPTVGSVFHELLSKTAGSFTFDQTTDSLEALRDRGDAAWITATGFSTLDAAGVRTAVGLASANLDTQLTAIDDYLDTEVAAIKTKTDFLPSATAGASGGLLIAGSNAATTFASVTCTGSLTISDGLIVSRSSLNGSAIVLTGNGSGHAIHATGGTTGNGVYLVGGEGGGDGLHALGAGGGIGLRASTLLVTGAMTANITGSLSGSVGSVGTGGITAASIATGAIDADALAADAVTEIWSKAMTELSSVPGVTGTALEALQFLFLLARNRVNQTSTTQSLRNNADDANIATASVSDDGSVFTRQKWS